MHGKMQVPDGWEAVRLGDVATMSQGGTPPKNQPDYWDGHVPFVTGADLTEFRITREHARSFLTTEGLYSGDTVVCEAGALLLATRTRVGLAGMATETMGASQDITCLVSNGQAHSDYLCRVLLRIASSLQRKSRGTTIQGITRYDVVSLPILLPPLSEQRAIAAVLDSIDEAIERTEAVITATERLRDALLHELLTRGVPGWHTAWKDVPGLGTIPACWKVVRLGEVATLQRGVDLPIQDRVPGSVPVYGSNGILGTHVQTLHPGPGVITGRSGSIGVVYFSTGPYWPLNTTLYVRDFHGNSERFIYYLLSQLKLERFAASTGVPSLNRNFVHPEPVPLPPLPEQRAIAGLLDRVDESIERVRDEREALQSLKTSTAVALLTGQVRVADYQSHAYLTERV